MKITELAKQITSNEPEVALKQLVELLIEEEEFVINLVIDAAGNLLEDVLYVKDIISELETSQPAGKPENHEKEERELDARTLILKQFEKQSTQIPD